MTEPAGTEEGREEAAEQHGPEPGNNGAVGKRDSDASSGSEGSQQRQQGQQAANKSQQAQGSGQSKSQGQGENSEDGNGGEAEKFEERSNIQRHVEASPQGRYLRFQDRLGTGQYKVVYRSYDTSMGIEVAWNTVNIKNLPKEEKKRIMNEVRLLQNLEHKNLVQFHGSWVNRDREEVIFVTEIMQSGSLMDFIRKVEMIRWRVVKRWARQILRGMHYLHSQEPPIIHRDLKCDNIFINGAAGDIRIGDLGLSTSNTRSQKTMSVLGTPEFMAPELYEEIYNEKVDIYAFGMCMLEMVTKERPYSECVNAAQIYRKVTSQILPAALDRVQNTRAREFIRVCLSPDPDERPSAMDLQNHPFLKDRNEDEDNSLVMLDPPATGEAVPLLNAAAASTGMPGTTVNAPAKIDPTLPGVAHPAARGTPGLDTITEAITTGGSGSNQGQAAPPQNQGPTASSHSHIPSGSAQGQNSGAAPQAQAPALASFTPGHSGASNSVASEPDGDSRPEHTRKASNSAPPMTATSSNDREEAEKDALSGGGDVGTSEQGLEQKNIDAAVAGNLGKADSHEAVCVVEPEEAQFGAHRIPGNPPFESDDDEDEQEHDMSHPEGFLRAMPEDESGMRVLKLPDGRVQRVEDDDDEAASGSISSDEDDVVRTSQAAPSSAQAPPLSSGLAPPPAGVAPAPPTEAPKPGAVGSAGGNGYGLPPVAFLSRENSGSLSSAIEGNSIVTIGSSTPGTVSPSGILPLNISNQAGATFTMIGAIEPALAQSEDKGTSAPAASFTGSDPGLVSVLVGPPVDLQRARSFSPVDRAAEVLGVAAMPPTAPAPPAPSAPSSLLHPYAKFRSSPEALGRGNGPTHAAGVGGEGDRTPFSSNQGNQDPQGLLSGVAPLGGMQTEIKVANLQGPEQEIMRLVMHTHVDGRLQEVEFDFNLDCDSPEQVSAEMIADLGLLDEELGHISLAISNLAETARRRRMRRHSSSNGGGTISQIYEASAGSKLFDANSGSKLFDSYSAQNHWGGTGGEAAVAADGHRGAQGSAGMFGSGGGDAGVSGGSEGAENEGGNATGGANGEVWSDDELDIEEDDEFRKRKMQHDKKKRQAEKVFEARLAALEAARHDREAEHERAKERYRKDCEDFLKKAEKLKSEQARRMEECSYELRGLEDGYRQKHRDAKQAKRHSVTTGMPSVQVGQMRAVGQPPMEPAPKPQSYAQAVLAPGHGQGQIQSYFNSNDGVGQLFVDDGPEQQPTTLSQHKSGEDVLRGNASIWSSNPHHHQQDLSAIVASAVQQSQQQGPNPSTDDEERRDRLSTL